MACVMVLEEIRKMKSEKNVSIKFPIKILEISGAQNLLEPTIDDLKSAGNVESVTWGTSGSGIQLAVKAWGEQADVA